MKNLLLKKLMLAIIVAIIFCTIIISLQNNSLAAAAMPSISDIEGSGDGATATSVGDIVGAVLYVAKIVAVGLALIMLAVLAMKYMSAAPGEKATIKKHAVVYVVGAIVLFGAAGILNIIETFATKNIKES